MIPHLLQLICRVYTIFVWRFFIYRQVESVSKRVGVGGGGGKRRAWLGGLYDSPGPHCNCQRQMFSLFMLMYKFRKLLFFFFFALSFFSFSFFGLLSSLHSFHVCFELLNLRFSRVRISDSRQQAWGLSVDSCNCNWPGQLAIAVNHKWFGCDSCCCCFYCD